MLTTTAKFADIASDCFLRCDEKYHRIESACGYNIFNVPKEEQCLLADILKEDYQKFDYEDGQDYKGIPTGQAYIDEDGDIIDFQPVTLDDHPDRLKYAIDNNHILISSLRLAKSPALMFENIDLSDYVFSNGFYSFIVNDEWNKKYVLYLLRTKTLKSIIDCNIYRGIGISAYKVKDLLRIPVRAIPKRIQDDIINEIQPFEDKISKFKNKKKSIQEIIDSVFQQEFDLDIIQYRKIDTKTKIVIKQGAMIRNNCNLRFSYRWNKAAEFQNHMMEHVDCASLLGKHIISTQNGWSPSCNDNESGYQVLGVDAISTNGILSFDNPKFSSEYKKDFTNYCIHDGDFFVSRGNTVALVSLAAVAHILDEKTPDTVYPDLMIKVEFDDDIDKQYMAYVFNSFIGRYYFKYSTKGKNQTMVKVSPQELNDFIVPLPDIHTQKRIVDEIQSEIKSQDDIKAEIAVLRKQIDDIIINTIST